jgi:hypothetical protein
MANGLIANIGFFCKSCGRFFRMIGMQHRDSVSDQDGWGVEAKHTCPACGKEHTYRSEEATLESEKDRAFFGISRSKTQ